MPGRVYDTLWVRINSAFTEIDESYIYKSADNVDWLEARSFTTQETKITYTRVYLIDQSMEGEIEGLARAGAVIEVSGSETEWNSGYPTRFGPL